MIDSTGTDPTDQRSTTVEAAVTAVDAARIRVSRSLVWTSEQLRFAPSRIKRHEQRIGARQWEHHREHRTIQGPGRRADR